MMKDQADLRRKSQVYGTNELAPARSSMISLASNDTGISGSSGGSASTITQTSYLRSKQPSEPRRKSRKKSEPEKKAGRRTEDDSVVQPTVDVFEFLVEEEESETHRPEMTMIHSQALVHQSSEPTTLADNQNLEDYYRDQMSESVMLTSPVVHDKHLDSFTKHTLPPLFEEPVDYSSYGPAVVDPYYPHEHHTWTPYVPPVYTPDIMPLSPTSMRSYPYTHEYAYRGTPDPPSTGEASTSCLHSAPLGFRDRGKRNLSHPGLFRSFGKVSERILMQMQSNIAELEHELAMLDAKLANAESKANYKKGDASNAPRQSHKDRSNRTELYQDLHAHLQEYHEYLSSFHQMKQITSPATPTDTMVYKSWLQVHVMPTSKIAPLLHNGSDLVHFGPRSSRIPDQMVKIVVYGVTTNVLLPLLLFKSTNNIISRLILLSLTSIASVLTLDRHGTTLKIELIDTFWHCIIICSGISLLAAIVF